MSKFKPGDRVAVYDSTRELFGAAATVQGLLEDGRLYVQLDIPTPLADTPRLHFKQCRRLVKKKRREIWMEVEENGDGYSNIEETWKTMKRGEKVIFRQVKK